MREALRRMEGRWMRRLVGVVIGMTSDMSGVVGNVDDRTLG